MEEVLWRKCADWAVLTDRQTEGVKVGEGPHRREERCVFSELSEVPRCRQSLPGVKGHRGTSAASSALLEQSDGEPKASSLPSTPSLGEEKALQTVDFVIVRIFSAVTKLCCTIN